MIKQVYICGPYRAPTPEGIRANIERARQVRTFVFGLGGFAVCPHIMSEGAQHTQGDDFWLQSTLELMRRCDGLVLVSGWMASSGSLGEISEARCLGMPIFDREICHEMRVLIDWLGPKANHERL